MLKKIMSLVLAGIVLATMPACVSTNSTPMTEAQRLDRLALVLKTSVAGVVTLAAEDRKEETREQIRTVRAVIASLVARDEANPQSIGSAINPLLQDAKPEVRLAVMTAFGVLDAYWGDYVV